MYVNKVLTCIYMSYIKNSYVFKCRLKLNLMMTNVYQCNFLMNRWWLWNKSGWGIESIRWLLCVEKFAHWASIKAEKLVRQFRKSQSPGRWLFPNWCDLWIKVNFSALYPEGEWRVQRCQPAFSWQTPVTQRLSPQCCAQANVGHIGSGNSQLAQWSPSLLLSQGMSQSTWH